MVITDADAARLAYAKSLYAEIAEDYTAADNDSMAVLGVCVIFAALLARAAPLGEHWSREIKDFRGTKP
jgi:hypothetical protein